jgi:peptide-methionine (S)-S-oxide reductase
MPNLTLSSFAILSLLLPVAGFLACNSANATSVALPAAEVDAPLASSPVEKTAVVAGGCFWGIQAVFQHVKGVTSAVSGYSGGAAETANYDRVCSGDTGHAESVKVTYDASKVTYGQLLRVFFSVAHDPTEMNRQGPDTGEQYRSAVFFADAEQQRIASAYIAQLDKAHVFPQPIVTQVVPLKGFYPAEQYHQDYATNHPHQPYIMVYDAPKVTNLRRMFPQLYTDGKEATTASSQASR